MCGRFTLGKEPNSLLDYFHLHGEVPNFNMSYNIAPTQLSPIVFMDQQRRTCGLIRWGLIPSWSQGPDTKFNMINARAESITDKPAYRTAFKQRRCLVPVDGYYEWSGQAKPKQPYFIYQSDRVLFALAGIWEAWQPAKLEQVESARAGSIHSFSIITTDANTDLQNIHHRMPVIIKPEQFEQWLLDDQQEGYRCLLTSAENIGLKYHPVNTRVNSVSNNSLELVKLL